MRQFVFAISFLALFVAAAPAQAADAARNDVEVTQLENGLQVVAIPDRRAPVVTQMIWYRAGSADEPRGKSGIAHFLEHMMFKGTSNVPAGEFSTRVAEIGGEENAFTSYDYTAYYQKVSPDALEMVMTYEADRMRNIVLTDEMMETERTVILEERRSRVDSSPAALLGEASDAALFGHHPYGIPVIGWEHEIRALTVRDAMAFYDAHYAPANAVLVVAGDVEPQTVFDLARLTYGKIPASSIAVRERVDIPEPVVERRLNYADPRVTAPSFDRSYLVPSYTIAAPGESEALDLLAAILGGSSTSRLYETLVSDQEIALSAGAWYQGATLDETRIAVYARPRGETTLEEIEAAIDAVVDDLLANGITQEELDRHRNVLIKSTVFERDSQTTLARIYGTVFSLGGDVSDIEEWPQRLGRVTVDDVEAVARKYLQRPRSVTSYLLPVAEAATVNAQGAVQ